MNISGNSVGNSFLYHLYNCIVEILSVENLISLTVDYLTLFVHNIVVLQYVLSYCKVTAFNLFL